MKLYLKRQYAFNSNYCLCRDNMQTFIKKKSNYYKCSFKVFSALKAPK